ncbi:TetR/AcrR family transcriptional regulator [Streptomyces formicae]|uniref:Transcriptional regulator, TetR family n=1 Tax=Streptomyces formicae TaxID=1616117 RepID=A0A291QIA7_9ACTN|nr:TetR/AcrR family transcriptional regulator [Streptomyces formicae]ATL31183.1 Transcriptional regulator, TetR family [Streptomyces formicae]
MSRADELAEVLTRIVATRGLEQVSVREVAGAAGVSIGAVQHHFATKDEMLAFAFRHVVERTRTRISGLPVGRSPRRNLSRVLRQLLPLDEERRTECRVYVAFAARAALDPALAAIQRETQAQLLDGITATLREAKAAGLGAGRVPPLDPHADAKLLLAVVDGLTFDAVGEPDRLPPRQLTALLDRALKRLLG